MVVVEEDAAAATVEAAVSEFPAFHPEFPACCRCSEASAGAAATAEVAVSEFPGLHQGFPACSRYSAAADLADELWADEFPAAVFPAGASLEDDSLAADCKADVLLSVVEPDAAVGRAVAAGS